MMPSTSQRTPPAAENVPLCESMEASETTEESDRHTEMTDSFDGMSSLRSGTSAAVRIPSKQQTQDHEQLLFSPASSRTEPEEDVEMSHPVHTSPPLQTAPSDSVPVSSGTNPLNLGFPSGTTPPLHFYYPTLAHLISPPMPLLFPPFHSITHRPLNSGFQGVTSQSLRMFTSPMTASPGPAGFNVMASQPNLFTYTKQTTSPVLAQHPLLHQVTTGGTHYRSDSVLTDPSSSFLQEAAGLPQASGVSPKPSLSQPHTSSTGTHFGRRSSRSGSMILPSMNRHHESSPSSSPHLPFSAVSLFRKSPNPPITGVARPSTSIGSGHSRSGSLGMNNGESLHEGRRRSSASFTQASPMAIPRGNYHSDLDRDAMATSPGNPGGLTIQKRSNEHNSSKREASQNKVVIIQTEDANEHFKRVHQIRDSPMEGLQYQHFSPPTSSGVPHFIANSVDSHFKNSLHSSSSGLATDALPSPGKSDESMVPMLGFPYRSSSSSHNLMTLPSQAKQKQKGTDWEAEPELASEVGLRFMSVSSGGGGTPHDISHAAEGESAYAAASGAGEASIEEVRVSGCKPKRCWSLRYQQDHNASTMDDDTSS